MPITPDFEPLREPGRNGRLLGYYDARRGIHKIKRISVGVRGRFAPAEEEP